MVRLRMVLPIMLVLGALAAAPAWAVTPGQPDLSWGSGGVAYASIGGIGQNSGPDSGANATALALQPDGKVIAAGSAFRSNFTFPISPFPDTGALARFNSDGTLDPTFDNDGRETVDIGTMQNAFTAVAVSGGEIYAAGQALDATGRKWTVNRFTSTGAPDGAVSFTVGSTENAGDVVFSMAIQPDGDIVLAGVDADSATNRIAIVRLLPTLAFDTSFGSGGEAFLSPAVAGLLANGTVFVRSDHSIMYAGAAKFGANTTLFTSRFASNGTPDTGYGASGFAALPDPGAQTFAVESGATMLPDGSIVLVGGAGLISFAEHATTTGSQDTGFGVGGIATLTGIVAANGVFAQADGKLVVAAAVRNDDLNTLGAMRLSATGVPDTTYGRGGIAYSDQSSGGNQLAGGASLILPDDRLLDGGEVVGGNPAMAVARFTSDTAPAVAVPPVTPLVPPAISAVVSPPPIFSPPALVVAKITTPVTKLTVGAGSLKNLLAKRFTVKVACSRACRLSLSLVVSAANAKAGKLGKAKLTLATATGSATKAGTVALTPKIAASHLTAARKLKKLSVSVSLIATDPVADKAFTSTKSLSLK